MARLMVKGGHIIYSWSHVNSDFLQYIYIVVDDHLPAFDSYIRDACHLAQLSFNFFLSVFLREAQQYTTHIHNQHVDSDYSCS